MSRRFRTTSDSLASNPFTAPQAAGTIAVWFLPEWAYNDGLQRYIIGSQGSGIEWTIQKFSDSKYYGGWLSPGTIEHRVSTLATAQIRKQWNHLLLTWDDTANETKLYLNGSQIGTTSSTLITYDTISDFFRLGQGLSGTVGIGPAYMAEAAVWNRVLTGGEITSLAGGASPTTVANKVHYWPLAADINDAVGSSHLSNGGTLLSTLEPTTTGVLVTIADGDWTTPGTWLGGVAAGDDDLALIFNDVTVTSDITVGDGNDTTLAVDASSPNSTLAVLGATLTVKGSLQVAGDISDQLLIENFGAVPGGIEFDANSGVTPQVIFSVSTSIAGTGTSSARSFIRTKSGSTGEFVEFDVILPFVGAVISTNMEFENFDFTRIGAINNESSIGTSSTVRYIGCKFDECMKVPSVYAGHGQSVLDIEYCKWTNPQDTFAFLISSATPPTTGTRNFRYNAVCGTTANFNTPYGMTIDNNVFLDGARNAGGVGPSASYDNNFICRTTRTEIHGIGGSAENNYFYWQPLAPGAMYANGCESALEEFSNNIFDTRSTTTNPAGCPYVMFQAEGAPTGSGTTSHYNNLALPGFGPFANWNSNISIPNFHMGIGEHNTILNTVDSIPCFVCGGVSQRANTILSVRSNIYHRETAGAGYGGVNHYPGNFMFANVDTINNLEVLLAADAENNAYWNTDITAYSGLASGTAYQANMTTGATPPGANDVQYSGSPFVDDTRNMLTWGDMLGAADFDEICDHLAAQYLPDDPDYDANYTTSALYDWVSDGYRLTGAQGALLEDAGHDGETIGAFGVAELSYDIIIDDSDPDFSTVGSWTSVNNLEDSYKGTQRFHAAGDGSAKARWSFDVPASGNYDLYLSWPQHSNRATNVPTTVYESDGTTVIDSFTLNQELPCTDVVDGDIVNGTVGWKFLGTYGLTDGLVLEITDGGNEYSIADAARLTNTELVTRSAITINDGDFNDSANWFNNTLPSGLNPCIRHDMILSDDASVGDGGVDSYFDMKSINARLNLNGNKLTVRTETWQISDDTLAYIAGIGPTEFLTVTNNGSSPAELEFDCNAGVTPAVKMYRMVKIVFDGTTTAPFLVHTKADSAGEQAYFDGVALSAVHGGFHFGHTGLTKGDIIGSFYRLGSSSQPAFRMTMGVATHALMYNCYVDTSTVGVLPDLTLFDTASNADIRYNQWGNFGDTPLGMYSFLETTASFASSIGKANESIVRQLIGNEFHGRRWGVRMVNNEWLIKWNVFGTAIIDIVDTSGAIYDENFFYIDSFDSGEAGLSANGNLTNNFILGGPNWCNALVFQLNRSRQHTDNIIQALTTGGPVVCFGANDGGSDTTFTYKNNLVLPYQSGGGGQFIQAFSNLGLLIAKIVAEHNTIHAGTSPNYGAIGSWAIVTQDVNFFTSVKSNIGISNSVVPDTYFLTANMALNAAPMVTDSAPASVLGYNCHKGFKYSPAGSFDAITGDSNISDGTVYHSPMSGSTAPGQNDLVEVTPDFYDPTRDFLSYAVEIAGSESVTLIGKVEDAINYLADDPETRIPALNTWIKEGWRVTNPSLQDAGHDGETIGALEFFNPSPVVITKGVGTGDELGYIPFYQAGNQNTMLRGGFNCGFRFQRIGIPQGTVPSLAELSITINANAGTGAGGTIYGIDLDSARAWRCHSLETDFVVPDSGSLPFTTASTTIPVGTSTGVLTFDVTAIVTEILARAGWKEGYNIAFAIIGNSATGDDIRYITIGSASLEITTVIPTADTYRVEGHLEGQRIELVNDRLLVYNTLQGLIDLESQDIIIIPNGDADGITIDFDTSEGGTFSPTSHTFVGSEPAVIRYTPTTNPFKHYLSFTNDGGLTDPDDVLFMVRRERLFPDEAIWYWPADEMELDTGDLHSRFADYGGTSIRLFTGTRYAGHSYEQCVNYRTGDATRYPFAMVLYPEEGDPILPDGMLPLGENFITEGYPRTDPADNHGLLFDVDNNILHEMYQMGDDGSGNYSGYHCQFDVSSLNIRTLTFTSAAADGRPITPFVLTYDEVLKASLEPDGVVPHPLRFTIPFTALNNFIWDASHSTSNGGPGSPMYGTRMRLKADYNISGFSAINQAILRTLKKYGMYLEDGGLPWFISGETDHRWNPDDLAQLAAVYPYNDFETVDQLPHMQSPTSYLGVAGPSSFVSIQNAILDHVFGGLDFPASTGLEICLASGNPQDDTNEPTDPSYSRVSIPNTKSYWTTATNGVVENSVELVFPTATGPWGTMSYYGIYDDDDNLISYGQLDIPLTITSGDTPRFGSGTLDISFD